MRTNQRYKCNSFYEYLILPTGTLQDTNIEPLKCPVRRMIPFQEYTYANFFFSIDISFPYNSRPINICAWSTSVDLQKKRNGRKTFTGSCSGSRERELRETRCLYEEICRLWTVKFRAFQAFYSFYRDYELLSKVRLGSSVDKGLLSKHSTFA